MDLQLSVGARAHCLRVCCGFACAGTLAFHHDMDSAAHRERWPQIALLLLEFPQGALLILSLAFAWLTCTFTLGRSSVTLLKRANKLVSTAAGWRRRAAHQWPGAHRQATQTCDRAWGSHPHVLLVTHSSSGQTQYPHFAKPTCPRCRTCPGNCSRTWSADTLLLLSTLPRWSSSAISCSKRLDERLTIGLATCRPPRPALPVGRQLNTLRQRILREVNALVSHTTVVWRRRVGRRLPPDHAASASRRPPARENGALCPPTRAAQRAPGSCAPSGSSRQ